MKRAVLCVPNPQDYMHQLDDYSIMVVNPDAPKARLDYLIQKSDYSLLITPHETRYGPGADYPDERVFWYTSGTTGDSKFYSFTQSQIDNLVSILCKSYDITGNDRYVSIMPLWHAHGQGFYWMARKIKCEAHYLNMNQLRNLKQLQPTFVTAIPDALKLVGRLPLTSLRFIRSASSPLSNALYKDLKAKFDVPVIEAFGMTESFSHCFTNPLYGEQRIGTVGLPDGIDAQIIEGKLHIKGPNLFKGGWFDTGDLAEQDERGYYRILGRQIDQINIKGYKFNPVSLEQQIKYQIKDVVDCVIFGKDRIHCLFTGTADSQLVSQVLSSIHSSCRPYYIDRCEAIPISPSGKLSRVWLSQQFA